MNKLSKKQQAVLECALDKLYTFLREKSNVKYNGSILCIVFNGLISLNQASTQDHIAWSADINLKERKIYLITREVKRQLINSERVYNLFYMGEKTTHFTLDF